MLYDSMGLYWNPESGNAITGELTVLEFGSDRTEEWYLVILGTI